MARQESDREDMIREATALRNRVEWQLPGEPEFVFTGVRSGGSLSVYFGTDPVYHFSAAGGLRRAYADGFLYRTQGTSLARLHRERSTEQTVLFRTDLNEDELSQFLSRMDERLDQLRQCIADGSAIQMRSVSDDEPPNYELLIELAIEASPKLAPAMPTRRK